MKYVQIWKYYFHGSKLTAKWRRQWRRSRVFIANFELISHFFLVFLLLTFKVLTGWQNIFFFLRWITGDHTIHPLIERLLTSTGIETTPFIPNPLKPDFSTWKYFQQTISCSKYIIKTIKTVGKIFNINFVSFENILHLFLVFLLLTSNMYLLAGKLLKILIYKINTSYTKY